ncbi:MAG: amidohydrolase family protein [Xanthobacteraceae bacterium]
MIARFFATALLTGLVFASMPAAAQPSPEAMLRNMDADRNGKISRKEWRGPAKGFDRLDANRDGALTPVELQSASGVGQSRATTSTTRIPLVDVHVHIHGHPSGSVQDRMELDYAGAANLAIAQMDENNVRTSIAMVPPGKHVGRFDDQGLLAQARRFPGRIAVLTGGGTLNPIIHTTAADAVSDEIRRDFEDKAESALQAGAIGFGEMSALHMSYFPQHPFEEVHPDHPLFLLLADIAARRDVPIDLHTEIVPEDMAVPGKLRAASNNNPLQVKANLADFERLLAHNARARIILSHSADATGARKASLMRRLFERYPNLLMSLNVLPAFPFIENLPLRGAGDIKPDWLQLIKDFPDRFMIGSDQFYTPQCPTCEKRNSATPSLRWLELLPADIARKVAIENPQRVFKITAAR